MKAGPRLTDLDLSCLDSGKVRGYNDERGFDEAIADDKFITFRRSRIDIIGLKISTLSTKSQSTYSMCIDLRPSTGTLFAQRRCVPTSYGHTWNPQSPLGNAFALYAIETGAQPYSLSVLLRTGWLPRRATLRANPANTVHDDCHHVISPLVGGGDLA